MPAISSLNSSCIHRAWMLITRIKKNNINIQVNEKIIASIDSRGVCPALSLKYKYISSFISVFLFASLRSHIRRVWLRHGSYFRETWSNQNTHGETNRTFVSRRSVPKRIRLGIYRTQIRLRVHDIVILPLKPYLSLLGFIS